MMIDRPQMNPLISVIICAYSLNRYDMTSECIQSVVNNTYKNFEIILVIDGNENLKQKLESKFKENDNIKIVSNIKNEGASISRNIGIRQAKGEIIAFIDDDGSASKDWLYNIAKNFNKYPEIFVVGGKLLPIYENNSKKLPEEILWIVGGTYKGHPENTQIVRNVFTGNMAVKKSIFENINFEVISDNKETFLSYQLSHQLEDTLFCVRVNKIRPNVILYDPDIIAYHHIPKERLKIKYIIQESFFEGIMKARLEYINGNETLTHEHKYLNFMLISIIKKLYGFRIREGLLLLLTISSVGFGYICYLLKQRYLNIKEKV